MNIDFSLSIEDWMAYFEQFITMVKDFFNALGIQLFAEESTEAPEEVV